MSTAAANDGRQADDPIAQGHEPDVWAWELTEFGRDVLQILNAVFDASSPDGARGDAERQPVPLGADTV